MQVMRYVGKIADHPFQRLQISPLGKMVEQGPPKTGQLPLWYN
jgi:hypothetical protein